MHARERAYATRDLNRHTRLFDWGLEFLTEPLELDSSNDSQSFISQRFVGYSARMINSSADFFYAPPVKDYRLDKQNRLTWTSALKSIAPENNTVRAQFFPASNARRRSHNSRHRESLKPARTLIKDSGDINARSETNVSEINLHEIDLREIDLHTTITAANYNAAHHTFAQRDFNAHSGSTRAVVILPQWNAQPDSHVALARLIARFGIAALRVTLPYHEERRPPELERAEHLVSSNIGRTLQSVRQAVLDARAAVAWLASQGYTRIGIIGTSIGSCIAFLTFAHEPLIAAAAFNHVSGYFADVVWQGISTRHVRESIEQAIDLETLRACWLPISPSAYVDKISSQNPRPMRFIATRYDLTFPAALSRDIIREVRARRNIPLDVAWLPCGHYTLGESPWKYLDGYQIISFMRRKL